MNLKEHAQRLTGKKVTMPQARAFSVHLLTASGSLFAFLSLAAASEGYWTATFAWLGFALLVDGIDGPIARKLQVSQVLPNWSGEMLDNIIDYVTYVLIPAFALFKSGLMGYELALISSAIIVVSSAIYYADTQLKTDDKFFRGFPVVWNMLVFTIFVAAPAQWVIFVIILISAILSFAPINFLHPVRVVKWRPLNLSIFLLWCVLAIISLFYQLKAPYWLTVSIIISGIYIYFIGAIMQFIGMMKRD